MKLPPVKNYDSLRRSYGEKRTDAEHDLDDLEVRYHTSMFFKLLTERHRNQAAKGFFEPPIEGPGAGRGGIL